MNRRAFAASAAGMFAGCVLLAASGAQAHAHLVKATPAASAEVAAPTSLHLQFSEDLAPKFSGLVLTKDGKSVAAATKVAGAAIDATPAAALTPGLYTVTWHVVSDDTHRMQGSYSFTVK